MVSAGYALMKHTSLWGRSSTKWWMVLLHSSDRRLGLAEVALGITRRMGERNVHLACPETPLSHVVLDYRVLATEPVLRFQTLVDPLRRVTLLPRKTPVLFQYPVDHPVVRVQLRATWR